MKKTSIAFVMFCTIIIIFPIVIFPVVADTSTVAKTYYRFKYGNGIDDNFDGVIDDANETDVIYGNRNISSTANVIVDTWTNDFDYPVNGIPKGVCIGGAFEELNKINTSLDHTITPSQTAYYFDFLDYGNFSIDARAGLINVVMFYVNISSSVIMNGASQLWYRSPLAWDNTTYQGTQHYLNIYDSDNNLMFASTDSDMVNPVGGFVSRIPDPKILVDYSGNISSSDAANQTAREIAQYGHAIRWPPSSQRSGLTYFNRSYFQLNMNFMAGERYRFEEYIQTKGNVGLNNISLFMVRGQDIANDGETTTYAFYGTDYAKSIPMECSWGIIASLGKGRVGADLLVMGEDAYAATPPFLRSYDPIIYTQRFRGNPSIINTASMEVVFPLQTSKPLNIGVEYQVWSSGSNRQVIPNQFYSTGLLWNMAPFRAHDGNFATSAEAKDVGVLYYNYTIPVGAKVTSRLRTYTGSSTSALAIPAACFVTKLIFKSVLWVDWPIVHLPSYIATYVWNPVTVAWVLLQNVSSHDFYESEMTWDMSSHTSWIGIPPFYNITGTFLFNLNISDPDAFSSNEYQFRCDILNHNETGEATLFSLYPSVNNYITDFCVVNYGFYNQTSVYCFGIDIQTKEKAVPTPTLLLGPQNLESLVGIGLIIASIFLAATIVGVPVSATLLAGAMTIGEFSTFVGLYGSLAVISGTIGTLLVIDSLTAEALPNFLIWAATGVIRFLQPIISGIITFFSMLWDFGVWVASAVNMIGSLWEEYGSAILQAAVEVIWFIAFMIVLMLWSAFLVSMKKIAKGDIDGALRALFRPVKKPLVYLEKTAYTGGKKSQRWFKKNMPESPEPNVVTKKQWREGNVRRT